jgi:hypothetical protein
LRRFLAVSSDGGRGRGRMREGLVVAGESQPGSP